MKAMIFAAGLGTRLYPLTKNTPKALVKIGNKTFLEIVLKQLAKVNINEIVINVHHFAEQIKDFLRRNNNFGLDISISDESNELLDTGGGIKFASELLVSDEPILIHNVDVITDLDYVQLLDYHKSSDALITLAVRNRQTARYFLFDNENTLCGWRNIKTREEINHAPNKDLKQLAFSGIHVISPKLPKILKSEGKFSIVPEYLKLSKTEIIKAFVHDQAYWNDIGKPQELEDFMKNPPDFVKELF